MCEQVIEQSPNFFEQSAEFFRYFVCESYPTLPSDNFALAFHNTQSDVCDVKNVKHWHLLTYSKTPLVNDGFLVPCPFSCFALLILQGVNIQFTGEVFEKLQRAFVYNEKYELVDLRSQTLRRKLPNVCKPFKHNAATQTDLLSSTSLDRYTAIFNGAYGGEFSQIMDAFISGYGLVSNVNHSMLTHFELTCAPSQCMCYECFE